MTQAVPNLRILAIRVQGSGSLVLMGFGKLPERQITLLQEHGAWKLAAPLDGEVV